MDASYVRMAGILLLLTAATARPPGVQPNGSRTGERAVSDTRETRLNGVRGELLAREYDVRPAGASRWQSPNRRQELRFRYDAHGFSVESRVPDAAAWQATLRIRSITLGTMRLEPTDNPAAEIDGPQLVLRQPGFEVSYRNDPVGMRQTFLVTTAPDSSDSTATHLRVSIDVGGDVTPQPSANGVTLVDARDERLRLRYEDLRAWDASGRVLPARMVVDEGQFDLVVDAANAVFPVTVDPVSSIASWQQPDPASTQPGPTLQGEEFGTAVVGAGDVNGDGYGDVLIGAPLYGGAFLNQGAVYLYYGGGQGLATPAALGVWQFVGGGPQARVGTDIAAAGDLNGDGYDDFVLGAPFSRQTGEVWAFYGGPSGPSATPNWTGSGAQPGEWFGQAVAGGGDVNADGFDDVVVAAPRYDSTSGTTDVGRVVVYLGSPAGLAAVPVHEFQGATEFDKLGWDVAIVGDTNGNGTDDVAIGSPSHVDLFESLGDGSAYVYDGGDLTLANPPPIWERAGVLHNFGNRVVAAGDVDGDGCGDLLVGDETYPASDGVGGEWPVGLMHAYYSSSQGDCNGYATAPDWVVDGAVAPMLTARSLGSGTASAGDVNADGYADVILGGPDNSFMPGEAYVYFGGASGLSNNPAPPLGGPTLTPDWIISGPRERFGAAVGGAVDTDGDGLDDVIIGAHTAGITGIPQLGYAVVYTGVAAGIQAAHSWSLPGAMPSAGQARDLFGLALDSAGDIDGDGLDDLLVGAPWFDGGAANSGAYAIYRSGTSGLPQTSSIIAGSQAGARLGQSIAFVGDANSDGLDDFLVSSPGFGMGSVNLYAGSATSSGYMPVWSAGPNPGYFGWSLTATGDLNGDGVADFAIGAPTDDVAGNLLTAEGAVYVYLSTAGVPSSSPLVIAGPGDDSRFGHAVAGGGDPNGDGYPDLLVGAQHLTNGNFREGGAFLYDGPFTGAPATVAWSVEGSQTMATLGTSVAMVGDVNEDGIDDMLIGTPRFTRTTGMFTLAQVGRATIHYGSGGGPSSAPDWVRYGDNAGAQFAYTVAGGGDFNGDGLADVVIGAPWSDSNGSDAGIVYAYYGSQQGPRGHSAPVVTLTSSTAGSGDPAWIGVGSGPLARFGWALTCRGDLNGDGLDDLVVGAPSGLPAPANGVGEVFVYLSQR